MPKLRNEELSLVDLLTRYVRFTVPDFQRVYAWGETQAKGLLSDLLNAMRNDGWVYLGTMFLASTAAADEAQIADGQQRILTLHIILAVLRDLETDPAARDRIAAIIAGRSGYRFAPRDRDSATFRDWVHAPGSTLKPYVPGAGQSESALTESQRNILANRDTIVAELQGLDPGGRSQLLAFLAQSTEVSVITAPTLEDARNAYASTQSRGLVQAEVDKLKAELLSDCEEDVRTDLALQWEDCEANLGKEDLTELLEHVIFAECERKPQRALEADLTEVFGLPTKVRDFIESTLVPSAAAYKRILTAGTEAKGLREAIRVVGKAATNRIEGHLITLRRTNHDGWKAPAILAMRKFEEDQAALEAFLRDLERLASVLMIAGADPADALKRYAAVLRQLKSKSSKVTAFAIEKALLVRCQTVLRDQRMATHARYRMPVLLKLNDLLNKDVVWINTKLVSCEHILPRNGARTDWAPGFSDAAGAYIGDTYADRLGNLAILLRPDNRRADTKLFDIKRGILKASGYKLSLDAAKESEWTTDTIVSRSERLVQMLVRHWRLDA